MYVDFWEPLYFSSILFIYFFQWKASKNIILKLTRFQTEKKPRWGIIYADIQGFSISTLLCTILNCNCLPQEVSQKQKNKYISENEEWSAYTEGTDKNTCRVGT